MSATVTIQVFDRTPAIFRRLLEMMSGAQINRAVGFTAAESVRSHLGKIEQDSAHHEHGGVGGERTHFYEQAAQQTSFTSDDAAAVVSIAKMGFAQRYYGGPIEPVTAQWLTIPATAEAYGHRASEFDLMFTQFTPTLAALFPKGEKRKKGVRLTPFFWLVKHVDQDADTTVLPSQDTIRGAVRDALKDYFATLRT